MTARGKRPATGGGTPATAVLLAAGLTPRLHSYESGTSGGGYGRHAAAALGVPEGRIFKTLLAEVDGRLAVAVVPVSAELDLKALAAALGGKRAAMAEPAVAERATGYVRGGISPLGQRRRLPTVVDASAAEHPTIYVSAGRRGLQMELEADQLVELASARVAAISRS